MYIPKHFEEPRLDAMLALIRRYPLSTLVANAPGGLNADHIPLHWIGDSAAPYGTLRGHLARANPLASERLPEGEVLAIFQAENAYISPSWYAGKQESGKVVPTWNYATVHAYGFMRLIDDAEWIRAELAALTDAQEAGLPHPWTLSDAPADFVEQLFGQVVGVEIVVSRLLGKWKVSQNQPPANRDGVVRGLAEAGHAKLAALVAAGAG
ncbi:FMN-binding negative transcriptional regulator [Methylomonas sp. HYX-M1]|uniref:FMN-binding negative transcriptional regulator n=1 Tax=Methylomonas sp. HYX-M1 TaxID=3139307 RepID=UPI00345C1494